MAHLHKLRLLRGEGLRPCTPSGEPRRFVRAKGKALSDPKTLLRSIENASAEAQNQIAPLAKAAASEGLQL